MHLYLNLFMLVVAVSFFHILSYTTKLMNESQLMKSMAMWIVVGLVLIIMEEMRYRKQEDVSST